MEGTGTFSEDEARLTEEIEALAATDGDEEKEICIADAQDVIDAEIARIEAVYARQEELRRGQQAAVEYQRWEDQAVQDKMQGGASSSDAVQVVIQGGTTQGASEVVMTQSMQWLPPGGRLELRSRATSRGRGGEQEGLKGLLKGNE